MKNNSFRLPLLQSGALLLILIIAFAMIPSGDSMTIGGFASSFVGNFFKLLLFIIALGIGIVFSIAVFIGIFFAAISLKSTHKAAEIWTAFKTSLFGGQCSAAASAEEIVPTIPEEEYNHLKSELSAQQKVNSELETSKAELEANTAALESDKLAMEENITALTAEKEQLSDEVNELSTLVEELKTLAEEQANAPQEDLDKGIFSYMDREDCKKAFISKVEEALSQDMTYAQMDTFFKDNLEADLYQILKDHPSLTKDFIRSKRS